MIRSVLRSIKILLFSLRNPFFKLRGSKVGRGTTVSRHVNLRNCRIGNYCYIGEFCSLNHVRMGNYCSIAPDVQIGGMEHSYWKVSTSGRLSNAGKSDTETIIGNDVWIGAQCYLKAGVTVGNGAVIGAHSLVNKDVPAYSIVFGVPAKFYKYRFDEKTRASIEDSFYWDLSPDSAKKVISELEQLCNFE